MSDTIIKEMLETQPNSGAISSTNSTRRASSTSTTNDLPMPHGSTIGSNNANKKRTFKVIVIGDSGVGKTCLTFRFCSGHFPGSTEATIGVDFREKIVRVSGEEIRLQLWDTAGQERFRKSMVSHYYRNVSAVVFVYDVSRKSTFDGLSHWVEECKNHGLIGKVPMLVIGNKCESGLPMAVSTNMAQRYADDLNMPLFETSAKDDDKADHVEAIFMTLAHKLKHSRPLLNSLAKLDDEEDADGNHPRPVRVLYKNENYSGQREFCCF